MSRFFLVEQPGTLAPCWLLVDDRTAEHAPVVIGRIDDRNAASFMAAALNGADLDGTLPPAFDLPLHPSLEPF